MKATIDSIVLCVSLWTVAVWHELAHAETATTNASAEPTIPYLPTHHDVVRDLLWLADVTTNDIVYDLGSGDGRVVIAAVRDFGARKAVGIEINSALVEDSCANAAKIGVADRVQFIQGDLFTNDFSQASVAVLYLGHGANLDLRAKLASTLKPGGRIVSHQFGMGEWPPDKTLNVRSAILGMYSEMHNPLSVNPDVPDFATPFLHMNHDIVSMWIVPARVAGIWRGTVSAEWGDAALTLTLHQRLSGVSGSFCLEGKTNYGGLVQADLWGTHLRFQCRPQDASYGSFALWFDGHATGDMLNGTMWISQGQDTRSFAWAGSRRSSDFTGIWEWPGPKDSTVQMKIQRHGGQLSAIYLDKNRDVPMYVDANKPIPVSDFYDFGGGFYFTLLLGRQENGARRMGPEDGWLVGEAILTNASLSGTVAFYPYPDLEFGVSRSEPSTNSPPQPNKRPLKVGKREWRPVRRSP